MKTSNLSIDEWRELFKSDGFVVKEERIIDDYPYNTRTVGWRLKVISIPLIFYNKNTIDLKVSAGTLSSAYEKLLEKIYCDVV